MSTNQKQNDPTSTQATQAGPATAQPSAQPPKPNARQIFKMHVTEIRDHTPTIRELFLATEGDHAFRFRAGQFVMLHVPAEPKTLLRAYSIASTDKETRGFKLVFKYVENGPASQFVWSLKKDTRLDFTGPFGRVFFAEPPTEQVIFLNTGSGISQHVSFIESNLEAYPNLRYRLLFGVRTEADIYYRAELEALKAKLPNFTYDYVLSRPSPEWRGRKGYVQNFIADFDYLNVPSTFYLCGNGAMIKEVKAKLAAESFPAERILSEAFD
jgi:NAD(P)H-flavin reductase